MAMTMGQTTINLSGSRAHCTCAEGFNFWTQNFYLKVSCGVNLIRLWNMMQHNGTTATIKEQLCLSLIKISVYFSLASHASNHAALSISHHTVLYNFASRRLRFRIALSTNRAVFYDFTFAFFSTISHCTVFSIFFDLIWHRAVF
jgi:hypothetical protein